MAETALTAAVANALASTTDSDTGAIYPAIAESTYYTTMYRMLHKLQLIEKLVNEFRVFKDGDLTYGIKAGKASYGTNVYSYAGASAQALADDTTNYIWLVVTSGALVIDTDSGSSAAFPDPAITPHLPLVTIATGSASIAAVSGEYSIDDITDYRGRILFELIG